jgi:hypothetical protein
MCKRNKKEHITSYIKPERHIEMLRGLKEIACKVINQAADWMI